MAWWNRKPEVPTKAVVAAAYPTEAAQAKLLPQNESWQAEAWAFLDNVGQFRYAVGWKAEMVSRVRLVAARVSDADDEPTPLAVADEDDTDAPELTSAEQAAIDLVNAFTKGAGGSASMLKTIETHLTVPGESFLVGETTAGRTKWVVYSADEIRRSQRATPGRPGAYEVQDGELSADGTPTWRELESDSLVIRVWRPHPRWHYKADSAARSMRPTLRELELINRKIQAKLLSRLATAGVFLMPDEVSFPTRPEFQDADDPFVLEWIETAKEAIAHPGTASAVIPIPMRVPGDTIEKNQFKYISFYDDADSKDIEARNAAIQQLAIQVDVPPEILTGMDGLNHWGAWAIEEQAVKTHIASDVELIVDAFTTGYLVPMLRAMGEDPTDLVIWYDTSELTAKPDLSQNAEQAYERNAISTAAYLRAKGFDPSDAPDEQELAQQMMVALGNFVTTGPWAHAMLTGDLTGLKYLPEYQNVPSVVGEANTTDARKAEEEDEPEPVPDGPVGDEKTPPVTEDDEPTLAAAAILEQERVKREQANARHIFEVGLDSWTLHHPEICRGMETKCPVAQATRVQKALPGATGMYEARLGQDGLVRPGLQTFEDITGMVRGHTRSRRARQRA